MAAYKCAVCGNEVAYEGALPRLYPFCSPRCKMVDLGRWLREQYTIDRDLTPDELDDVPPERPRPRREDAGE